jgi:tetratricopeptide (TPR) repeat protein
MRLLRFVFLFVLLTVGMVWAQDSQQTETQQSQQTQGSQAQPQAEASQSDAQASSGAAQGQDQGATGSSAQDQKKPGPLTRLKKHVRDQMSSGCVNAGVKGCWDKPPKDKDPKGDEASLNTQQDNVPSNDQVPRSDRDTGESSSKSTKIDLSPPPGEPGAAPGADTDSSSDVQEMKPWNPHKADKNVEVGDFYFRDRNYRAAASRYKEALYWQDNHAIATEHLAEALEKMGDFNGARQYYQNYLKILPNGPDADKVKEALQRLNASQAKSEGKPK